MYAFKRVQICWFLHLNFDKTPVAVACPHRGGGIFLSISLLYFVDAKLVRAHAYMDSASSVRVPKGFTNDASDLIAQVL